MRAVIAVAVVGSFALLSWGCSDPSRASSDRILRVGTSGDYAPFSLEGEGFDLDVARRFAEARGYTVEWVPFRWPELSRSLVDERFDVAMSGVTWRPERAVHGFMTRAVAAGGPCLLGDPDARRVAVNRGGALEAWARRVLKDRDLRTVRRNLELPELLASGQVGAIVTDSFELGSFERALRERGASDASSRCEPPRERKVYWVSSSRSGDLGPELDGWLRENEALLAGLRQRWFGDPGARSPRHHLADLLTRRLALMPAVAAWKRARGRSISDPDREAKVLAATIRRASELGLAETEVRPLFELQIELAKRVQRRVRVAESLDLETELRPLILRLGERILLALSGLSAPREVSAGASDPWQPLHLLLEPAEVHELVRAIERVRVSGRVSGISSGEAPVSASTETSSVARKNDL